MTNLPNLYRVIGFDNNGVAQAAIVIRRKPSGIPISLDREISHMGVIGHMRGPDTLVMYEFFQPHRLSDAEDLLRGMGWKRIKKKEGLLSDEWDVFIGDKHLKTFVHDNDGVEAEEFLDKVMLGEISYE